MITRIVMMHFAKDKVDAFLDLFHGIKAKIANADGCSYLHLHRDSKDACRYFTISNWASEAHLEAYRQSTFFEQTWAKTKVLFDEKPQAWTLKSA